MVKLKSLIERLKRTPLDLRQLEKIIPKSCKAMQYKQLKNKNRRELFSDNEGIVLLIPSKKSKIGHFVCLLPRRNHIEYFSSLGNSPNEEIFKLEQDKEILGHILGKSFIYNSMPLQRGDFAIVDCGLWMLCRLYLRELKLREFQTLFSSRLTLQSGDDIASILAILLLTEV